MASDCEDFESTIPRESSPETDCLSIISDYSEMGFQIKQSIRYNEINMSTYADLKNPSKLIVRKSVSDSDSCNDFRRHNMLNLALEFSRWSEQQHQQDHQPDESGIDYERRHDSTLGESMSSDLEQLASPQGAQSPRSFSSAASSSQHQPQHCPVQGSLPQLQKQTVTTDPLGQHVDHKLESCFSGHAEENDNSSSGTESNVDEKEQGDNHDGSTKEGGWTMTRQSHSERPPSWARTIFHRDSLQRMPASIRDAIESIPRFNISHRSSLECLNVSELQVVINSLFSQVEEFNGSLVLSLITRDELKSFQTDLVSKVEALSRVAQSLAKEISQSNDARRCLNRPCSRSSHSYSTSTGILKFFSTVLATPKNATGRLFSLFSTAPSCTSASLPAPEYV